MRRFTKAFATVLASFSLVFAAFTAPAQADEPALTLALDSNNTFADSVITGYAPDAVVTLSIYAPLGTITWWPGATRVQQISPSAQNTHFVQARGPVSDLVSEFWRFSYAAPCTNQSTNIYGQLSEGTAFQDPNTGHLYQTVSDARTWEDSQAYAQSTPLVAGGADTFGYIANISSDFENSLVAEMTPNDHGWLGANDTATEGDWKWLGGPEADTLFYQGAGNADGAAVDGLYNHWNQGEPNDWGGNEDYAIILKNGGWNDYPDEPMGFVMEFGGQVGDNLSQVPVQSSVLVKHLVNPFAHGDGTQDNPYQVGNANDLSHVIECSGVGTNFLQTDDIGLINFTGLGDYGHPFVGTYDGDGFTIDAGSREYTNGYEGFFNALGSQYTGREATLVKNLNLHADVTIPNYVYQVGLLAGVVYNASVEGVNLSGSMTGRASYWGGVTGYAGGSYFDGIHSSVAIHSLGGLEHAGGLFGLFSSSELYNSSTSGDLTIDGDMTWVGGIGGEINYSNVDNVSSTSNITVLGAGQQLGGIIGYGVYNNIQHAKFGGSVIGNLVAYVGGIVGFSWNNNGVYYSVNTGDISGADIVGGLVGEIQVGSSTRNSYSNGQVTSVYGYGGSLFGDLSNSTAEYVIGYGSVSAARSVGWAGSSENGQLSNVYWVPSSVNINVPDVQADGVTALSESEAKVPSTFADAGFSIGTVGNGSTDWMICPERNNSMPYLFFADTSSQCTWSQTLTPDPTVSGTGYAGEELTADAGTWDEGTSLSYQWYADGEAIEGATDSVYTLTEDDLGKEITVEVTGSKQYFSDVVRSSSAVVGQLHSLVKTPTPNVTGTGFVGDDLTATAGTWDDGVDLSYQWQADGVDIDGATDSVYTPTEDDVNKTITVVVTGSMQYYQSVSKTTVGVVGKLRSMVKTPTPTLSGTGVVGSVITATVGTWDDGVDLAYEWQLDGATIEGEDGSTYTVKASDAGHNITYVVSASAYGFAPVTKTSAAIAAKTAASLLSVTLGTFAVGSATISSSLSKAVTAAVKAHSKATTLLCTALVKATGTKAAQKALGLKRANAICALAKKSNSKLKVTVAYAVSASSAKIKDGVTLKFNK